MNKSWSSASGYAAIAAIILVIFKFTGCREAEKVAEPVGVSVAEAASVPPPSAPLPNLNIDLDQWVADMNRDLKASKLPTLLADAEKKACKIWCTTLYYTGKHIGYLVAHRDNKINDIIAFGSGDGTDLSGVEMMLGYAVLMKVLSPSEQTAVRGKKITALIRDSLHGKNPSTSTVGGVRYSMTKLEGAGVLMTASKD